jgi:Pectate lyase superfamily protein
VALSRRALLQRAGLLAAPWIASWPRRAWGHSARHIVRDHGASGDGKRSDTAALQSAIDAAARSRGVVVFPPGEYVSDRLSRPSSGGGS